MNYNLPMINLTHAYRRRNIGLSLDQERNLVYPFLLNDKEVVVYISSTNIKLYTLAEFNEYFEETINPNILKKDLVNIVTKKRLWFSKISRQDQQDIVYHFMFCAGDCQPCDTKKLLAEFNL